MNIESHELEYLGLTNYNVGISMDTKNVTLSDDDEKNECFCPPHYIDDFIF